MTLNKFIRAKSNTGAGIDQRSKNFSKDDEVWSVKLTEVLTRA